MNLGNRLILQVNHPSKEQLHNAVFCRIDDILWRKLKIGKELGQRRHKPESADFDFDGSP